MGGGVSRLFGGGGELDNDLAPICAQLKLGVADATRLYKKFQDIDTDCSGCIEVDEFFAHISQEPTPFARKLFTLIDQNGSGEIDFNEFLVGLWNICTFDDEALLRFAFNLIDEDSSGYVDEQEVEECVRGIHGSKLDRRLIPHVKKVLRKYDKNKDGQYSFDEFKACHRELPSVFMPAFGLKNCMEEEFYGAGFWKRAAKARKKDLRAQSIREFMQLNAECQKVAPAKFQVDSGPQGSKQSKTRRKSWEARGDSHRISLNEIDGAPKPQKSARELRREAIHKDPSGVKQFSLDHDERFGIEHDPERNDRRRASNFAIMRDRPPEAPAGGYEGPRKKSLTRRQSIAEDQARTANAKPKRRSSMPDMPPARKMSPSRFGAPRY